FTQAQFRAGAEQFFDDHVCCEPLAHAAWIEPGVGGKLDRLSINIDPDAARVASQRADARRGVDRHRLERSVVPLADQVAQDRRVEPSARVPPAGDRAVEQPERVRRHGVRSTAVRVEEADLARGDEAAPSLLELFDPYAGYFEQVSIAGHEIWASEPIDEKRVSAATGRGDR